MGVRTFEELYAWQLSVKLREAVIAICEHPKVARDFKFCDAIREAARSAPNLIAEGFGRFGRREFRRYLSMARGEQLEVRNALMELKCRHYVDDSSVDQLIGLADYAGRVTAKLRSSLDDFDQD